MSWSNEQKVFVIGAYYRLKSYKDAQAQFRQQYPEERRNFPHVNTIKYLVKMFKKIRSVSKIKKKSDKKVNITQSIENWSD